MNVKINPYLNFNGNTEEAFNFYKSVFGGDFFMVMRYKDTPEGDKIPEADANKIMHMSLPIGEGNVIMGTDMLESMGQRVNAGENILLSISASSKEDADKVFSGLSAGGKVEIEMQNMFWGEYFGMFKDKFGIAWMVSFNNKSN